MKRGIGGTECGLPAAFYKPELAPELAKYANVSDLWMRLLHGIERPRTAVMERGLDAEPRLRKALVDAFGYTLEQHERPWVVQHPKYAWATCSPDDKVAGEPLLIEIKSTSTFARAKWGRPESDEIPMLYGAQVQWCLEILDLPRCLVFVGFGRDWKDPETGAHQFLFEETLPYVVERDRELAATLLSYAERFVTEFIDGRQPPPIAPVHNKRAFSRLMKGEAWTPAAEAATEAS